MSQTHYSRRLRKVTWLSILVPTVAAVPLALLYKSVQPGPGEHFWLVLGGFLFLFAVAFVAALPWWRTMDDMQRQGHMVSWYWGGLGGGTLMLSWLVAGAGGQSDAVKGAIAVIFGQVVGFLIFWAVWALRRRGAPE